MLNPNITYCVLVNRVLHEFEDKHKAVEFVVQQETEKKKVKMYRRYIYSDTSLDNYECIYSTTF